MSSRPKIRGEKHRSGYAAESGSGFKRTKLTKDFSSIQNKTIPDIQVLKYYNRCNMEILIKAG